MTIAIISGSGFYDFEALNNAQPRELSNKYGNVRFHQGNLAGHDIFYLARHGKNHHYVSHQIPHQAHIRACVDLKIEAIISLSVVGVINGDLPLGHLMIPKELYYPDNRLPNGQVCTLFQTPGKSGRGHLIMDTHFNLDLRDQLAAACQASNLPMTRGLNYAYIQGPRFNSKLEIKALANLGIDMLSQTLGPEAVLAGEREIPYAALTFGIDYANGVKETPTPIETLNANLKASKGQFSKVLEHFLKAYQRPRFEGVLYRFE